MSNVTYSYRVEENGNSGWQVSYIETVDGSARKAGGQACSTYAEASNLGQEWVRRQRGFILALDDSMVQKKNAQAMESFATDPDLKLLCD